MVRSIYCDDDSFFLCEWDEDDDEDEFDEDELEPLVLLSDDELEEDERDAKRK